MLSIATISQQQSVLLQQGMLGMDVAPETGEFDFMNYLLGLGGYSLDMPVIDEANPSAFSLKKSSVEESGKEDALLSLFEKKNDPLWNPIFPIGCAPASQSSPEIFSGEVSGEVAEEVVFYGDNTSPGLNQPAARTAFLEGERNVAATASQDDSAVKLQDDSQKTNVVLNANLGASREAVSSQKYGPQQNHWNEPARVKNTDPSQDSGIGSRAEEVELRPTYHIPVKSEILESDLGDRKRTEFTGDGGDAAISVNPFEPKSAGPAMDGVSKSAVKPDVTAELFQKV
mgnify:CR=1 FL=1